MMKQLKQLGIALVVLAALVAPASASDSKDVIKVALLDMSALMNYGMSGYGGGGYGMMGPGCMMPYQGRTNPPAPDVTY